VQGGGDYVANYLTQVMQMLQNLENGIRALGQEVRTMNIQVQHMGESVRGIQYSLQQQKAETVHLMDKRLGDLMGTVKKMERITEGLEAASSTGNIELKTLLSDIELNILAEQKRLLTQQ